MMKETGVDGVKLEGGEGICPQIRAITAAGIPVCAHVGMTPQSYHAFGGFTVQGKGEAGRGPSAEGCLDGAGSWGLCRGSGVCSP